MKKLAPSSLWLLALNLLWPAADEIQAAAARPASTPVNQVFQFTQAGTCTNWSDGSKNSAVANLWIPDDCVKVRGLLILCANVPEEKLASYPAVREVCAKNDLGIVWCSSSFMNWSKQLPGKNKMSAEHATTVGFLQELLNGLAKTSGYTEVATVPWLPIGESGHLLMVDALVTFSPQRCIAGMWLKNNHLGPKIRQVPAFVAYGSAQEWGQTKGDIRTNWCNIDGAYAGVLSQIKAVPGWPLTYMIDGHSGHFDCSDRLANDVAHYIDRVAQARLSEDGSPKLKPVNMASGFVADLPVPGHEGQPIKPAGTNDGLPWFFDEASAKEAQSYAAINWKAESQLPDVLDIAGQPLKFDFNGIPDVTNVAMEPDGITFSLRPVLLDQIPAEFACAGEKLAQTPGEPEIEWLCGPLAPLGNNRFQICLDRAGSTGYLGVRKGGTDSVRGTFQPLHVNISALRNQEGKAQTITFDPISDVKAGTESVPLVAKSDAGLPVSFLVRTGPVIVQDGKLVFTPLPPRTKYPVDVTVEAWQWGRSAEPKIKGATSVKQTFKITAR